MTRFFSLAATLIVSLMLATGVGAAPLSTEEALAERVMGDADAPITIIEYASLTCPHCARFHMETLPELKSKWIDTGKAKIIYRDFPTAPAGPSFAASMIARCAPQDRYFSFLDAFFRTQETWVASPDPRGALGQMARLGGLSEADFNQCLDNEALLTGIRERAQEGSAGFGVRSTPSFIINGKLYPGNRSYEEFADILESLPQ